MCLASGFAAMFCIRRAADTVGYEGRARAGNRRNTHWQPYVSPGRRDTLRYKPSAGTRYNAFIDAHNASPAGASNMKRLLAMFAFLAGGLATELAHPVQCLLVNPGRMQPWRQRPRSNDGNH